MRPIELAYGQRAFTLNVDEDRFSVLSINSSSETTLSDVAIGNALDSPIASAPLDELIRSEESVLLVVSDATRATASAQIVNLVVRRLIQSGVSPANLAIIFATGIHRAVTEQEKVDLLTPFIIQRVRTLVHDAYNPSLLMSLGTTERGVPVEVNKALNEYAQIILIGGIGFHYFAGFTGGRKSVCPGLASAKTIEGTHILALDFEKGGRKSGVGTGLLEGNAVHEECERVTKLVGPAFGINTIVDEQKRAVGIYCGDWRLAHRHGCEQYFTNHSIEISAPRELVIVSCGGFPHDINLIQAHKALDMASQACKEGGSIILLAECRDGFGRPDFLKWFESVDSLALEKRLLREYEVNGQTAWSLLTKAERHRVYLVSDLAAEDVKRMRMIPVETLEVALKATSSCDAGFVMPRGAAVLPVLPAP
ncbi:MAG TPA: nickel-dependent lactate racemase [Pyrinomonadaceae bacterium]|jgi:nickel-dependent lactate racemase|nr:nickel-dependent lactate racemase [Pyrinomonadaceae bacterium]